MFGFMNRPEREKGKKRKGLVREPRPYVPSKEAFEPLSYEEQELWCKGVIERINDLRQGLARQGIWVTGDGRLLRPTEFDNSHLWNTLNSLTRKHRALLDEGKHWEHEMYNALWTEAVKRGMPVSQFPIPESRLNEIRFVVRDGRPDRDVEGPMY